METRRVSRYSCAAMQMIDKDKRVVDRKPQQRCDLIDEDTRQRFEIKANGILAFVDCDRDKRAKLRAAIVDAMLWAQHQK